MNYRMPALYLSHGAPPLLDDPHWGGELAALAQRIGKPQDILIVSAHWEAAPVMLSASGAELVYDFGGFAPRYYQERYDTPDSTALAERVTKALPIEVHQHPSRGLDHGAWVPLKLMYPDADIPVTQMSIPTHDPESLLEIGRRLAPLRDEGTLIIGSGFMTHGLPFLRDWSIDAAAPGWSKDFDAWASEAISEGDVDVLSSYRDAAPGMPYAHPTVEHYTPLFVALGTAEDPAAPAEQVIDGFWMGLSKRSLLVA